VDWPGLRRVPHPDAASMAVADASTALGALCFAAGFACLGRLAGPYSTSFAVCNSLPCQTLSVTDSEVVLRDLSLRMEESFPLRAGAWLHNSPRSTRAGQTPARSLFNIEEQKWRSRGILNAHGRSSNGWVIHEVVHWEL